MELQGAAAAESPRRVGGAAPAPGASLTLLRRIVADVLCTDGPPLQQDAPLMQAGITSQAAVMLRNRLLEELPAWRSTDDVGQICEVPATLVFDHPTLRSIAGLLEGRDVARAVPAPDVQTNIQLAKPPVVLLGGACRLPSAIDGLQASRAAAASACDSGSEVPLARWDVGIYFAMPTDEGHSLNRSYTRHAGFAEGVELFDAPFFAISSSEAATMDPGQRVLLEICCEAAATADRDQEMLNFTATGVVTAQFQNDWPVVQALNGVVPNAHGGPGLAPSIAANRISFSLGLEGPSLTVDTACSSALVAADVAIGMLRVGRCSLAFVAASNLLLAPNIFVLYCSAHMLSLTGRCRTFDRSADGYMRSDGLGAVVLATEEEGEWSPKICKLCGSALNSDGRSASLTAPRGPAQEAVLRAALRDAAAAAVELLECHGTGTPLGDPVEASAARRALCEGSAAAGRAGQVLLMGSIKGGMGHAEGSAGMAGLIRLCTTLDSCVRPSLMPMVHLHVLNSSVRGFFREGAEASKLLLATEAVAATHSSAAKGSCRSAGVSSFGFGGSNAHIVARSVDEGSEKLETQVPLPAYRRRRFAWTARSHPLLDRCLRTGDSMVFSVRLTVPRIWKLLCHHIIHNEAIVPAAAFLEMAAAAVRARLAHDAGARCESREVATMRDVGFFTPLVVATAAAGKHIAIHDVELMITCRADGLLIVSSCVEESLDVANPSEPLESRHCESVLLPLGEASPMASATYECQNADSSAVCAADFYARASRAGYTLGPRFRTVRSIRRCPGSPGATSSFLALLQASEEDAELGYLLHPAVIDGAIQLVGLAPHGFYTASGTTSNSDRQEVLEDDSSGATLKIPVSIRSMSFAVGAEAAASHRESQGPMPPCCWARAEVLESSPAQVTATIVLFPADQHASAGATPLLSLQELRERSAIPTQLAGAVTKRGPAEFFFESEWQSVSPTLSAASGGSEASRAGPIRTLHALQLDFDGSDTQSMRAVASAAAAESGAILINLVNGAGRSEEVVATLASLARVLSEVAALGPSAPPVVVATADSACIHGGADAAAPAHAGVWGLIRTARHELPSLCVIAVDVSGRAALDDVAVASSLLEAGLLNALAAAPGEEELALVAQRDASSSSCPSGIQWQSLVRRLIRHRGAVPLSAAAGATEADCAWASGGAYLISGGLGGVGLETAVELCRAGAAELTLLSRSGRSRSGAAVAERLRRPGASGASEEGSTQPIVSVVCCDIADSDAVSAFGHQRPDIGLCLNSGERRRRGVIHAAGMLSDAILANVRSEHFRTALRPKVLGAQNLRWLIAERLIGSLTPLDFFCAFSSIVGVLGAPGQASYAAANAALDAQVEYWRRRAQDSAVAPSCVSVQWGPWGQVGMAVLSGTVERQRDIGWRPIRTELGMRLLRSVLGSSRSLASGSILTASFRWQCYLRHLRHSNVASSVLSVVAADLQEGSVAGEQSEAWSTSTGDQQTATLDSNTASSSSRDVPPALRELLSNPEALASEIQAQIQAIAREIVPGTSVENDMPLMDLGIDSLAAVEFRNRLQRSLGAGVWVPNTVIFDYPTVGSIAGMLSSQILANFGPQQVSPLPSPGVAAGQRASAAGSQMSEITVASVSCHLAGCVSRASTFRALIKSGCDSIHDIPSSRWDVNVYYGDGEGQSYTRHGGFMEGLDLFDPVTFGLGVTEAKSMDPGQRVLLEIGLDAMLTAGCDRASLLGSDTSVAVAQTQHDWACLSAEVAATVYTGAGVNAAISANRFSYTLGMRGPSVVCDTACSSSLVALDASMAFLLRGRSSSALSAAVNVMLVPWIYAQYCAAHMLSALGRCLTFDAGADGYARAEGVSAFFLSVGLDLQTSTVRVAAVGVNNDGRSASLTAPNGPAQQHVMNLALAEASMQSAELGLMECHGTGTSLGDPIELGALNSLHPAGVRNGWPLLAASMKSHLGHAEAAAGASGLARLLVMMLDGGPVTAPGLHVRRLNPNLPGSDVAPVPACAGVALGLAVEVAPCLNGGEWTEAATGAAAVSSFGFGGTNAHLILRGGCGSRGLRRMRENQVNFSRQAFPWRAVPDPLEGFLYELRWRPVSDTGLHLAAAGESAAPGDEASARRAESLVFLAPASESIALTGVDQSCLQTPADVNELRNVLPHGARSVGRGSALPTIVFLRSATIRSKDAAASARACDSSPVSPVLWELLAVVQALCSHRQRAALIVATVMCPLVGLARAQGQQNPQASQISDAALWGIIRSFRLEAPWISARLVDIDGPSCCASALSRVLDSEETDVAFRGQTPLVPRLLRSPWQRPEIADLRVEGCHLITGGTGGIGLLAALALAGRGAESLLLVSRRGEISPSEVHVFNRLSNLAPATHLVRADVTDEEAVRALASAPERLGVGQFLTGIVHTAQAPLRYTELASQSEERFLSEFGVRAIGAWNLHKATRALTSIRYFVGVTSLNSTMGQGSNAAISAGNLALDGLVQMRLEAGLPGQTLQFSRVADVGSNAKNPLRYAMAISSIRELPASVCEQFLRSVLAAPGPPPPLLLADADWDLLPDQIGQDLSVLSDLASAAREAARAAEEAQPTSSEACNVELLPDLLDMEKLRLTGQPVAVVGGGFGGVMAARELLKRGLRFVLFERAEQLGGSWRSLGNRTSRVQIERGTYNLNLDEPCPSTLPNYTQRDELLAHLDSFVLEHGLAEHTRCSSEVVAVSPEGSSYRVDWRLHREGNAEHTASFGAVMVFPGFLPRPRLVTLPGEADFSGCIGNGLGDDISPSAHVGQQVVVLGHGAFAVEHARTAVESGAKLVSQVCRRRNLVLPRVVSWLIDGACGVDMDVEAVLRNSAPMYRLLGFDSVAAALPASVSVDSRGRQSLSQTNPAISDVYFLFQMTGHLRVLIGSIEAVHRSLVAVRLLEDGIDRAGARQSEAPDGDRKRQSETTSSGSQLLNVPCSVIVKCLGWDHAAHASLDSMLGLHTLRGFWIDGDPRRFLFKFSSSSRGARGFNTLSFSVLHRHALAAFFHFLARPAALAAAADGLPTVESLAEDFGTTYVGQSFLALAGSVQALRMAGLAIDALKAQRISEAHPTDNFIQELEQEWAEYQARLLPCSTQCPYPYSSEMASSLRNEVTQSQTLRMAAAEDGLERWVILNAHATLAAGLARSLGSRSPAGGVTCVAPPSSHGGSGADPELHALAAGVRWLDAAQAEEIQHAAGDATVVAICVFANEPLMLPSSLLRQQGLGGMTRVVLVTSVGGRLPMNARNIWQQWESSLQNHRDSISTVFSVNGNVSLLDLGLEDGEPRVADAIAGELLAQHLPRMLDQHLERSAARSEKIFRLQPAVTSKGGVLAQSVAGPTAEELHAMVLDVAAAALGGGSDSLTGDTPLLDAGLDSLGQIDLRQILGRSLGPGVSRLLTAAALFEHPTVRALADFLHESIGDQSPSAPTNVEAAAKQPLPPPAFAESQPAVQPSQPLGPITGDVVYADSLALQAPRSDEGCDRACGVLMPEAWVQRPRRVLFLHGARADADVTLRVMQATGWVRRLKDVAEFAFVDAPHDDRADPTLFEGLVRLGWYDASNTYRLWNFPRKELELAEDAEDAAWSASLEVIQDAWETYGPFDGLAGMCEGAAAAALAALTPGCLEPKPRFLLLINSYPSDHARYDDAYSDCLQVPVLHLVGEEEDAAVKVFPDSCCWDVTMRRVESIPGRHNIPELTEELEESVRNFLAGIGSRRRRKTEGRRAPPVAANQPALTPSQPYLRPAAVNSQREFATAPRLVLIIFPHAGGSAMQFDPLAAAFPSDVVVWLCEYPGHGERALEPPLRSMRAIVQAVREELLALVASNRMQGAPLLFLGHSMGSVAMTLLAERLFADGPAAAQPVAMIASGRGPPHVADSIPRVHLLTPGTEDFVSALGLLSASFASAYRERAASSPAVREAAALIQHDFAACFEEDPWPRPSRTPWPVLLVVLYGESDRALCEQVAAEGKGSQAGAEGKGRGSTPPAVLQHWQELSKSPVLTRALQGGHDYVQTCDVADIVAAILDALSGTHLGAVASTLRRQVSSSAVSSSACQFESQAGSSPKEQRRSSADEQQDLVIWLREQIVRSIFHASPKARQHFISIGAIPGDAQTNQISLSAQGNDLVAAPELMGVTFAELGLGSLEWLLIREMLSQALEIRVPPQLIFKGPTVASLADLLVPLLRGSQIAMQKAAKQPQAPSREISASASQQQAQPVSLQNARPSAPKDCSLPLRNAVQSVPQAIPMAQIGENVRLGENVRFEGPICIRDGAVIKDNVTFGGGCEVGEFAVIGPHVQLGPNCKIAMFATLQEDVVLGEQCEVLERAVLRGPLRAGSRNQFQQFSIIGGHSQHGNVSRSGHVNIGSQCVFEISSVVLAPRGRDDGPEGPRPGVTQISDRAYVHMRAEVSHDCTLEEDVDLVGELTGYCHVMQGAKVMKGVTVHQFTTIGTGAFLAMGSKVRYDVLPYCIFDENTMVLDRVALRRLGISSAQAEELEAFYERHFASNVAHYCQSVEEMLPPPAESHGVWYAAEIRRFFAIRARMRDQRMLSRFGSPHEPLEFRCDTP